MRWFDNTWTAESIAAWCKGTASGGFYTGLMTPQAKIYTKNCTVAHQPSGTIIMFTHDKGAHDSGWWKNPDYNACQHLSLSFRDPKTGAYREKDKKLSKLWIEAFFGPLQNLIWAEPPYSSDGKRADVWHYRVFFDDTFTSPHLPRGEVYSKTWTPAHWLSWSDMQAKLKQEEELQMEQTIR
jgi:hypothetical protein